MDEWMEFLKAALFSHCSNHDLPQNTLKTKSYYHCTCITHLSHCHIAFLISESSVCTCVCWGWRTENTVIKKQVGLMEVEYEPQKKMGVWQRLVLDDRQTLSHWCCRVLWVYGIWWWIRWNKYFISNPIIQFHEHFTSVIKFKSGAMASNSISAIINHSKRGSQWLSQGCNISSNHLFSLLHHFWVTFSSP